MGLLDANAGPHHLEHDLFGRDVNAIRCESLNIPRHSIDVVVVVLRHPLVLRQVLIRNDDQVGVVGVGVSHPYLVE